MELLTWLPNSADEILQCVADEYHISKEVLSSKGRVRPLPEARQMAAYLLTKTYRHKGAQIGKILNRTVNFSSMSRKHIESHIKYDKILAKHYANIIKTLQDTTV